MCEGSIRTNSVQSTGSLLSHSLVVGRLQLNWLSCGVAALPAHAVSANVKARATRDMTCRSSQSPLGRYVRFPPPADVEHVRFRRLVQKPGTQSLSGVGCPAGSKLSSRTHKRFGYGTLPAGPGLKVWPGARREGPSPRAPRVWHTPAARSCGCGPRRGRRRGGGCGRRRRVRPGGSRR